MLFRRLESILDDPGGIGVFIERFFHVRIWIESLFTYIPAHFVEKESVRFFRVFVKGGESWKEAGGRRGGGGSWRRRSDYLRRADEAFNAMESTELSDHLACSSRGLQMKRSHCW